MKFLLESGHGSAGLRHAWAFATEIKRRVLVNRESLISVCRDLDVPWEQGRGVLRILRQLKCILSLHRRMACVMRDWGLDDDDIAEMFAVDVSAVRWVREFVDVVREREPIPSWMEAESAWLLPDDLPPDELYRRAAEVRALRTTVPKGRPRGGAGIRHYTWDGSQHAFIPIRT
jgi:hypothetical protein